MIDVDTSQTLQVLARAQLALANSVALVLEAVGTKLQPQPQQVPDPLSSATSCSEKPPPKKKSNCRTGRKSSELDGRVFAILESRPGTSVAELEREINEPGLCRSRLEWSLRRLLEKNRIVKTGNTCGARYSAADSQPTAPLSSLRVVGS